MSHNALPITPVSFAHALTSLTLPSLHSESLRLQNSIYHLRRSNLSLEHCLLDPSLPADDQREFRDAIRENEEVIKRQEERIELVKQEVERRGFRMPHEGEAGAEVGVEVEEWRGKGEWRVGEGGGGGGGGGDDISTSVSAGVGISSRTYDYSDSTGDDNDNDCNDGNSICDASSATASRDTSAYTDGHDTSKRLTICGRRQRHLPLIFLRY
ncbi:hypothetical protein BDZ91DRAFT_699291 [Kalaharituber pfeilii]|nr:hypothetical protein BDZ91DRAFT_699291 [Kalaharituber pfeilii]